MLPEQCNKIALVVGKRKTAQIVVGDAGEFMIGRIVTGAVTHYRLPVCNKRTAGGEASTQLCMQ